MQGLELPSLVRDIVSTLKRTFKNRFDPRIGDELRMLQRAAAGASQPRQRRARGCWDSME
jgi:hypothetical protein